jgi:hypothetical protein
MLGWGILWVGQAKSTHPLTDPQTPNQVLSLQQATTIPDHVFYGEVFSLLVALDNTTDYQKLAKLTDDEVSIVTEIAKDCQRDIVAQDAKAQIVITAFRERLKELDLQQRDPKKMLPLPAELTQLQEGRNAIVLHHRDRLRKALGDEAFRRFTEAARKIVTITLTPA